MSVIAGKFGPGVDYTGICATRDEQLNAEDEQIFNELCPPNTYVKIPHVDCEDD